MKKIVLFSIFFLAFLPIVNALNECKYTEIKEFQVEEYRYYLNGKLLNESLNITYVEGPQDVKFKIDNPYDFDVSLEFIYRSGSPGFGEGGGSAVGTIKANTIGFLDSHKNTQGEILRMNLTITSPDNLTRKFERFTKSKVVCKDCRGKECLDYGQSCTWPNECGTKYCVSGTCSPNEYCYNTNCQCKTDELGCKDKGCVKAKIISNGNPTNCQLPQECISGFLNQTTKLCDKTIEEREQDANDAAKKAAENERIRLIWTAIILAVVVVGILGFVYLKKKR